MSPIRHATDKQILTELFQKHLMDAFLLPSRRRQRNLCCHRLTPGQEEFGEAHRGHIQKLHSPHRKWNVFGGKLQQGSCGDHMKLWTFLIEITKAHNGTRTALNLIQKEEIPTGHNARVEQDLQL